jgi:hypothetical protein
MLANLFAMRSFKTVSLLVISNKKLTIISSTSREHFLPDLKTNPKILQIGRTN